MHRLRRLLLLPWYIYTYIFLLIFSWFFCLAVVVWLLLFLTLFHSLYSKLDLNYYFILSLYVCTTHIEHSEAKQCHENSVKGNCRKCAFFQWKWDIPHSTFHKIASIKPLLDTFLINTKRISTCIILCLILNYMKKHLS